MLNNMDGGSRGLGRTESDRTRFLRTAWSNPAFTDVTLVIRHRGSETSTSGGHEGSGSSSSSDGGGEAAAAADAAPFAPRYVDCIKFQLAKHSEMFRWT